MSLAKMHELAETNLFVTIFIELSVQTFSKFVSTSPVGFQYDPRWQNYHPKIFPENKIR